MSYYKKGKIEIIPDELSIYQVQNDPTKSKLWWYAYIKLRNEKRVRRSLKTTNVTEAEERAKRLYYKLRSYSEENIPIHKVGWTSLRGKFDELRIIGDSTRHRLHMLDIYFAKFSDIKDINSDICSRWEIWRRNFWSSPEGKRRLKEKGGAGRYKYNDIGLRTLKMEANALKMMLKFAFEQGFISSIPEIRLLKTNKYRRLDTKSSRRAAFSASDHRMILNYINNQYQEHLKNQKRKTPDHYRAKKEGREYYALPIRKNRRLWAYIHLLHKSGLRPQEAHLLRWRDIKPRWDPENETELMEIFIDEEVSKVNRARYVYVVEHSNISEGTSYLWSVLQSWKLQCLYKEDDDFIFGNVLSYGDRYKPATMSRYFNQMIQRGFTSHLKAHPDSKIRPLFKNPQGLEYSAYSYRHMYATEKLRQGVNVYYLSELMGTSFTQIKNHYGHLLTWDTRHNLLERQSAHMERYSSAKLGVVRELKRD